MFMLHGSGCSDYCANSVMAFGAIYIRYGNNPTLQTFEINLMQNKILEVSMDDLYFHMEFDRK